MHELAITESIVESVTQRLPDARVVCVRLAIGRLSGVSVPSVEFCFGPATEDTGLAGARLVVDEPAGRMRCRACAAEFASDDLFAVCDCGSMDVDVIAGQELLIRAVEVRGHV
ncbi:hydrogenase maturation nickel metallochaperone HypA [Actinocrinis puniceicyclus]|uniref:Hydrogenase maturation factor HypA n=1 Tax=Actinocrinis puniceicyclus TaxID=977794 RepID=A0A8J7WL51_9ACTN|nr:hydrogenase maturation nickel metallochaperone HypA [Actinocrinis puniceicyclus]MBS2961500.1 hydrogenase maturation nickel metallochaperone HypA [Actinocrinis puniceicyclus]